MKKFITILLIILIIGGCVYYYFYNQNKTMLETNPELVVSKQTENSYVVSTSNSYATDIGCQILENGGNAVDAAVAISYALRSNNA